MSIPLGLLNEPATRLRDQISDDAIDELARSLATHGLLQPILVRQDGDAYNIIAGHRRYLAARSLGWTSIYAVIRASPPNLDRALALTENVVREAMDPVDEARALRTLQDEDQLSTADLARRLGKSYTWIAGRLALLDLDDLTLKALSENTITLGVARALADVTDPAWRATLRSQAILQRAHADTVTSWWAQTLAQLEHQRAEGLPTNPPGDWEPPPEPHFPCWACNGLVRISTLTTQYVCRTCLDEIRRITGVTQPEAR